MMLAWNYFVVAWRNLLKYRLFAAINIAGLSVGVFACILIMLFVRHELSYDRFFSNAGDIYRLAVTYSIPGRDPIRLASSPAPTGPAVGRALPEVRAMTRMIWQGESILVAGKEISQPITYVDPEFFNVFDFPLLRGNRRTALRASDSVVLTRSAAKQYFGTVNCVGRILTIGQFNEAGTVALRVTAVMDDLPHNTHLKFSVLAPITAASNRWPYEAFQQWTNANLLTYVRLEPGTDRQSFQRGLEAWNKKSVPDQNIMGAIRKGYEVLQIIPQKLTDIHLMSNLQGELRPPGSLAAVLTFSAVAMLIMIIAAINFMNLAMTRAMQRSREVAIRKVLGARRGQLVLQFLAESVLLTLIAFVIAIAAVELALPRYDTFLAADISAAYSNNPVLILEIFIFALFFGIITGLYPAFVLSASKPAQTFRGEQVMGRNAVLRNILVILQFSISTALLTITGIVFGQTIYAKNLDLGYDRSHIVVVAGMGRQPALSQIETFRKKLFESPAIRGVTFSTAVPTEEWESNTLVQIPGHEDADPALLRQLVVDYNFFDLYGIDLVAGRTFSANRPSDRMELPGARGTRREGAVILNEAAVARLGLKKPEKAIGKKLRIALGTSETVPVEIVGVVGNFHFNSLHQPIHPTAYFVMPEHFWDMSIRIDGSAIKKALKDIDHTWKALVPGRPIDRRFLEDSFNAQYLQEERQSLMLAFFSGLAILVACMGLLGLAAFSAERRTKEIGIRKVLGASTFDIVRLLLWQFSQPVLLANLLAWPLAFYFAREWLNGFAYRIELHIGYFLGASLITLSIAWITVAVLATRVARSSPAQALRRD